MTTLRLLPSRFANFLLAATLIVFSGICFAQQPQSATETTSVTDATGATAPYRVDNQRTEENGRVVERHVFETPSINGGYAPISDVEQETIKVDDNTTKVIRRAYTQDANGGRKLFEVTEEERRVARDGSEQLTRNTSRADNDNRWQVVERETQQSVPTGKDSSKTTSTVMRLGVSGLVPVQQTQTTEQRTGNTTHSRQVVSKADPNGSFQLSTVKEIVTTETPDGRTKDEKTLADDGQGHMVVVGQTVSNESNSSGVGKPQQNVVQEYSVHVPGAAADGKLHLIRRTTETVQRDATGATETRSQVESVNAANPSDGLHTVTTVTGVSQPAGTGQSETRTIVRDVNGGDTFGTVFVTDSHETKSVPPPAPTSAKPTAPSK